MNIQLPLLLSNIFKGESRMRLYLEPHKICTGMFGGWKLVEEIKYMDLGISTVHIH